MVTQIPETPEDATAQLDDNVSRETLSVTEPDASTDGPVVLSDVLSNFMEEENEYAPVEPTDTVLLRQIVDALAFQNGLLSQLLGALEEFDPSALLGGLFGSNADGSVKAPTAGDLIKRALLGR